MRKILILLPLMALIVGCSDKNSLEEKGRDAGAAADKAIENAGKRVDAGRDELEDQTAIAREKAEGVKQDVKAGLDKAGNAVDAAEAELKK